MLDIDPSLRFWSWGFLSVYLAMMIIIGFVGMRRVKNSDDFATARGSYASSSSPGSSSRPIGA